MPKDMIDILTNLQNSGTARISAVSQMRERENQRKNQMMDALYKRAQIQESGYDISPDEQTLSPRADYVSARQAQAKKDMMDTDILGMKLQRMKNAQSLGGGGAPLGAAPLGYKNWIDPNTGDEKLIEDKSVLTPYQQEMVALKKRQIGSGDMLTPGQKLAKDKATQSIFDTVENNKVKRQQIEDAEKALPNAPSGFMGKMKVEYAKRFNPDDPMLGEWQKIKSIGTDAQLLNTARTKGAISDKEMALFATASANDDLISIPRLRPIMSKLKKFIEADEAAKFGAYKKNYNEDPRTWFQDKESIPTFGSEAEVPADFKGPAIINGKKAVIE